jgi:GDP-D-glucose phosphorylase
VFINASPLAEGHGLLTLHTSACLPQVLNRRLLTLALRFAALSARPDLRVGYNSLGAFASVNHFHMHIFYAAHVLDDGRFPCERSPGLPLASASWGPAQPAAGDSSRRGPRSIQVVSVSERLVDADIPHNVLVADRGRSVYVLPRQKQRQTGDGSIQIALAESCGLGIYYDARAYETATEASLADTLRLFALPAEGIELVRTHIRQLCRGAGSDGVASRPGSE